MALVTVILRDVSARFHGYLASAMLEVAPNVFISPKMSPAVRTRIWETLADWHGYEPMGSVVMVWRDVAQVGGVGLSYLGTPVRELIDQDGMWMTRRAGSTVAL